MKHGQSRNSDPRPSAISAVNPSVKSAVGSRRSMGCLFGFERLKGHEPVEDEDEDEDEED